MERFLEFAINHWDLFLALFFIIGMMFSGNVMRRISGYHEVDTAGAVQLMNHQDALVVDVRETNELKEGMIPESKHIPLSTFASHIAEINSDKKRAVVVSCRSGNRSSSACAKLRKDGFENVYNLKGGIMAWKSSNLPLEIPGRKKKRNR
jgi:rhodanese-related sulfurtransferase